MNESVFSGLGMLGIPLIIVAVLAFLMPFFIFKIRNQVVKMNDKMDTIIELLSNMLGNLDTSKEYLKNDDVVKKLDKRIKICPKCGRRNRYRGI